MARTKKPTAKQIAAPSPAATLIGPLTTKPPAKPPPIPPKAQRTRPRVAVPRPVRTTGRHKVLVDPERMRSALADVLAAPADDAPRAVYAELLRSAGDARGEFILAGLDLAKRGLETDDRYRDLLARNGAKWSKPMKALGKQTRWRWHRGFVTELRLNGWEAGCTPGNLTSVLANEPVSELTIEGCDPELLARLVAVPGIEGVRRLAVMGWDASDGGAFVGRVLAKASRLSGVTELRVGIKLGDSGLTSLIAADSLSSVVHLAVGAPEASVESLSALAASPMGQQLEILEWLREPITGEMGKVIVTMPCLQTFVASVGETAPAHDVLTARFRDRFVIEDEPGMQYLLDGVQGISHRPVPKR
jgi:uncharacterized protein (TIGR02996 family)